MPKSNGDASSFEIGTAIAYGLKLREEKRKAEADVTAINKMIEDSDAAIMSFLNATGQTEAKTEQGTAKWTTKESARCTDSDKFIKYIEKSGEIWLLERRPYLEGCREYLEEHDKLPPGVEINSRRSLRVTKPTPKL